MTRALLRNGEKQCSYHQQRRTGAVLGDWVAMCGRVVGRCCVRVALTEGPCCGGVHVGVGRAAPPGGRRGRHSPSWRKGALLLLGSRVRTVGGCHEARRRWAGRGGAPVYYWVAPRRMGAMVCDYCYDDGGGSTLLAGPTTHLEVWRL